VQFEDKITLGDKRLLLLVRWLESNTSKWGHTISAVAEECIQEVLRKTEPDLDADELEYRTSEEINRIIWDNEPSCELHWIYGDWWTSVLEEWLQDGLETLLDWSEKDEISVVSEFVWLMDHIRVIKDVYEASEPDDNDREIVRQFLKEWQNKTFQALMNFLD